jgi:hypothetical protein
MRDLSVKGVTRRHAPLWTSIFIELKGGNISVREDIVGGSGSVRNRLESWARTEISYDMSECVFGWTVAYRQTWTHIVVRINLNPDAGISAATMTNLQNTWATTIQNRWSNAWGAGRSGELTCPFTFDVQWVNSNAHHDVRVRPGPAPTDMGNWDTNDSGAVASHEFGHMIGNPDEYPAGNCPDRSPVNTGTIMDTNVNNIPSRMLRSLAGNLGSNTRSLS